jgi:hypothetical protein
MNKQILVDVEFLGKIEKSLKLAEKMGYDYGSREIPGTPRFISEYEELLAIQDNRKELTDLLNEFR